MRCPLTVLLYEPDLIAPQMGAFEQIAKKPGVMGVEDKLGVLGIASRILEYPDDFKS